MLGWKKLTFNAHSLPGLRSFGASPGDTGPGGGTYAWVAYPADSFPHNGSLKNYYRSLPSCGVSPAGHVDDVTCWNTSQTGFVDTDHNPFKYIHIGEWNWSGENQANLKDSDTTGSSGMFKVAPKAGFRAQFYVKTENADWFNDECSDWNNPNWVTTSGKRDGDSKVTFMLDGNTNDYFSFDVDQDWGQVANTALRLNGVKVCDAGNTNSDNEAYVKLEKIWILEETNLPVNAEMSAWGDWEECINGGQKRVRTVLVMPANGGTPAGDLHETRDCTVLEGCTEPNAKNYNPKANKNVGCDYWTCECPDHRQIKANGQCGACDTGYMVDPESDCCVVDPDYDTSGGSDDDEEEESNNTPLIIGGVAVVGLLAVMMMRK